MLLRPKLQRSASLTAAVFVNCHFTNCEMTPIVMIASSISMSNFGASTQQLRDHKDKMLDISQLSL